MLTVIYFKLMLKYLLNVVAKEFCLNGTLEISQYGIQLLPTERNLDYGLLSPM